MAASRLRDPSDAQILKDLGLTGQKEFQLFFGAKHFLALAPKRMVHVFTRLSQYLLHIPLPQYVEYGAGTIQMGSSTAVDRRNNDNVKVSENLRKKDYHHRLPISF